MTAALMRLAPVFRKASALPYIGILSSIAIYGKSFIPVFAVVLFVWVAATVIVAMAKGNDELRWKAAVSAVAVLGIGFLIGRHQAWQSDAISVGPTTIVWFALEMWLTLRLVTLFLEVGSGAVTDLSLRRYLAWSFLPFWVYGPVLRYSNFLPQTDTASHPRPLSERLPDWPRLAALSVVQLVLGILVARSQGDVSALHSVYPRSATLLNGFILLPLGFYLSSAGFFHAMEVLGGAGGFTLPPSFRNPLLKRNISEFWASWNMSATSVFRDYIYYNRWGLQKHYQYLNITILFLAVGLWHGSNSYWIIWGGLHAVGFCTFTWYNRHPSLLRTWFAESRFGRPASIFITYVFVCSCWILPPTLMHLAGMTK